MNYVTLNGIKSTTIRGLLIQSLPPISKPLIRTQIEEIDGRDGDIVTKLGYSAYDKQITIGLFGDYNIDEVIAFFNSEGMVTFSNEIDKYYNYQILNQIDFERLIRFRTATVTFHVQPFKFSTIEGEKTLTVNNQLLSFSDFAKTTNGITVSATNGVISVSGTGTTATEIYMPINPVSLTSGNYTFNAFATGTAPESCSIRLVYESPSNANSFGGGYVTLKNNATVTINADVDVTKTYNYVYFYIAPSTAMNFTLTLQLQNDNYNFQVRNNGNYISKPIITIYGQDTINLSLNGHQAFVIDLGDEEYITIDVSGMEAYKDGILKNRLVTGDYDNFALNVGLNTISWTGVVTEIAIENYSRWL